MSDIGQHLKLPIQSTATKGAINFLVTVNNEHQRVGPDYFFSPVACPVKTYFSTFNVKSTDLVYILYLYNVIFIVGQNGS